MTTKLRETRRVNDPALPAAPRWADPRSSSSLYSRNIVTDPAIPALSKPRHVTPANAEVQVISGTRFTADAYTTPLHTLTAGGRPRLERTLSPWRRWVHLARGRAAARPC